MTEFQQPQRSQLPKAQLARAIAALQLEECLQTLLSKEQQQRDAATRNDLQQRRDDELTAAGRPRDVYALAESTGEVP